MDGARSKHTLLGVATAVVSRFADEKVYDKDWQGKTLAPILAEARSLIFLFGDLPDLSGSSLADVEFVASKSKVLHKALLEQVWTRNITQNAFVLDASDKHTWPAIKSVVEEINSWMPEDIVEEEPPMVACPSYQEERMDTLKQALDNYPEWKLSVRETVLSKYFQEAVQKYAGVVFQYFDQLTTHDNSTDSEAK